MALDPIYKAVGFDMDGTFMKTKIDFTKLANVIFDEFVHIGVPESAIIRTKGSKEEVNSGVRWLIENGREEDARNIRKRIADRSTSVEMEYSDVSRPFDGAVEVVKELRRQGYKTGILTRGGREYADHILGMNNVRVLFDAVVARDDFPDDEAKPSPKAMVNLGRLLGVTPQQVLFLGDNTIDWMSARDSGAGFYGVLTGGFRREHWNALDPDIPIIEGVASLLDMIK
jgi:phosphoglycolate phosphatase